MLFFLVSLEGEFVVRGVFGFCFLLGVYRKVGRFLGRGSVFIFFVSNEILF